MARMARNPSQLRTTSRTSRTTCVASQLHKPALRVTLAPPSKHALLAGGVSACKEALCELGARCGPNRTVRLHVVRCTRLAELLVGHLGAVLAAVGDGALGVGPHHSAGKEGGFGDTVVVDDELEAREPAHQLLRGLRVGLICDLGVVRRVVARLALGVRW